MKKWKLIPVCLLTLALLSGCGRSTLLDLNGVETDPLRAVNGATTGLGASLSVSVGDVGLFYSQGNLLKFYDTEAREEYVLCARANCTHTSEKCPAYFTNVIKLVTLSM